MSTQPCGCDPEWSGYLDDGYVYGWLCRQHQKERLMGEPGQGCELSPKSVATIMGDAWDAAAKTEDMVQVPYDKPEIEGIKNSGVFHTSESGMRRDANPQGAIEYSNILHGPMYDRWALHLTKAKVKYPDAEPGVPNWTLGATREDMLRFRESAFRHMRKWMRGDTDEDHAAACYFNLNGAEYVLQKLRDAEKSGTKESV